MSRIPVLLLLAVVCLGGCGGRSSSSSSPTLGRSLEAELPPAGASPAPTGDPPEERGGTIPPSRGARESWFPPGSLAPSPQGAVRRYALVYTNWQATSLGAQERRLASLGVGTARLTAEQTAESKSADAELAANHVQNRGVVLAIAPGQGFATGQWVVVTEEQTTGIGLYRGLPASPHVTLARAVRVRHGWAVNEWSPRN